MTASSVDEQATAHRFAGPAASHRHWWFGITRRGVQIALGVLWLVDSALQLQPFMFTADFARQVLAPAAVSQPGWVGAPVEFFARLIAEYPAPLNTLFVLVQLALGVGLLVPRLVRPAIVGSVAWSAGIWWFGEGLGGLFSGDASLVTGAPGAVLLYAVLALAAWPSLDDRALGQARTAVAQWFPAAWAIMWVGGALLQVLPKQRGTAALADQTGDMGGMGGMDGMVGIPAWLASLHHGAGAVLSHGGNAPFLALVAFMALVGLAGLAGGPWRLAAAVAGAVGAVVFWVLGQNIGELYSGQATDPNTGPLILLMAMALAGTIARDHRPPWQRRHWHQSATAGGDE